LFTAVAEGQPILLDNIEVPVAGASRFGLQPALLCALARSFKRGEEASAQIGPNRIRRSLPILELVRRWQSDRYLVSITDLHVRGTQLERDINTHALSAFNLLPLGSDKMRRQEMMTLVVSSRGNVTDSHSDDPDGSNHCFVGKKLWLAWETFEGQKAGLQDCSRDPVDDRARFKLDVFNSLKSAKWWTVSAGETLFLPGRFSHRVVTLEPYVGVGSFYCTPSSCLENLCRWYCHGPLWSVDDVERENEGLVDEIAATMMRKVRRLIRQVPRTQEAWGLDFVGLALNTWRRRWKPSRRNELMTNPIFAALVGTLQNSAKRIEPRSHPLGGPLKNGLRPA
jgi:hypothetical protein